MIKHIEVRRSPIHGRGVFATRRIQADQLIGVYEGERTRRNGAYVLWIEEDDGVVVGINGRNQLRFLNHRSKPNAVCWGEELFALKEITPGEEITIDYGEEWASVK